MGGAATALAAPGVQFCAAGNGCAGQTVEQFSWQQNSVIADNSFNNNAGANTLPGTLLGQGWLAGLVANGNTTAENNFVYVFSIDVSMTKNGSAAGNTVSFTDGQLVLPTATTATNYFRMYHFAGGATTPNFDAGLGAGGAGSLILEGAVFLDDNPNFTADGKTDQGTGVTLGSQTPVDIGHGTTTQGGFSIKTITVNNGSMTLDINVTSADSAYFRSDITSLSLDLNLSENLNDPFTNVRVPGQIAGVTPNFGNPLAPLNNTTCDSGTAPCDMIFAANGGALSSVFHETVPEPGTLALIGSGAFAALLRRRSKKRLCG
jgi:hypothetical protein